MDLEGFKLYLFDIDGTLISTGEAGNKSLDRAFLKLYNIDDAMNNIRPDGKTDPVIVREIYEKKLNMQNVTRDQINHVFISYLFYLKEEIAMNKNYKVIQGVKEFLETLENKKNIIIGLGTGNIEEGGKIKLARGGLNKYFTFGGFGSDSEDRVILLKIAKEKAEKKYSCVIKDEEVLIIGDTPKDIYASQKANFKVLATCTGTYKREELEKEKPDFIVNNLREVENL
jgi:phosphoglycolate phosphatase-like HAD superfamily hydrolase